jgi:hypothetical protein
MKKLLIGFLLLAWSGLAEAQKIKKTLKKSDSTTVKMESLFKKDSMLKLTIITNIDALQKDRGKKSTNHWAKLVYNRKTKGELVIPIKLKPRGNFRKETRNCSFPPLLVDFNRKKKKSKKGVFDDQDKIKLVTHCQHQDYIFQEYMVYKMYNLLTDYSFKARVAQITYEDSARKRPSQTKYAFFIEDEESLAKRTKTENFKMKQTVMSAVDSLQMATVAVFEYMIGNTDWSVAFLHNIKLLAKKDHFPLPVPYDFDHSGIVEAKYARPPEVLDLSSVRQRLYRGITYQPTVFKQVFDKFKSVKPQIYALYEGNTQLDPAYIKRTLKYLDSFYETIDDPKSLKRIFITDGGKNGTGAVIIKGLN